MRICIDLNPFLFQPTGVGKYIKGIFDNLLLLGEEELEVIGICSSYKYKLEYKEKENVKVVNIKMPSRIFNYLLYGLQIPIIDYFISKGIEIMHSPHPIMMPSAKAKKIITIHDLYFYDRGGDLVVKGNKFSKKLFKESVKEADLIICISHFTYNRLKEIFPMSEKKSVVIYPGFDYIDEVNSVKNVDVDKIMEEKELLEDYVLFVGTIEERKNLEALLKAIEILDKKGTNINLVMIGKIGYRGREVFQKISMNKNVKYLGYVSDEEKEAIYKKAKMLVMPSKEEGFGYPMLEAMQYGIPVIAAGGSSLEEIGGEAVYIINNNDAEGIANAIIKLREDIDLRKKLIKEGYERCKMFSWYETVKKVLSVYKKLLS